MKRILSLLAILVFVTSCLVIASAQPKKRKSVIGSAPGTGAGVGRNKAEPGQTVTPRNGRRGRWETRNGKRIWVPQGSPSVGNRRGVVEREQLQAVKKNKPTSNTNRP